MPVFKRSGRRRIVVGLADTHAGHGLGLLNPDTVLVKQGADEGETEEWTPDQTETQRRIWHVYQKNIRQVSDLAGRDEVIVFHDGDLTNGDKYHDGLIPEVSLADQREIAYYNMLPLLALKQVKKFRLVSGTPSHVPNSAEARVAHRLARDTGKDVKSYHHARADVDGEIFDVAHHGPGPSIRDWLQGNNARYYLRDRIYRDRRLGVQPARVYMRAHFHIWLPETIHDRWQSVQQDFDLTVLPSYSGLTGYARQVTKSEPVLINGLCCYEIIDGRLVVHPFIEEYDLRTEETL